MPYIELVHIGEVSLSFSHLGTNANGNLIPITKPAGGECPFIENRSRGPLIESDTALSRENDLQSCILPQKGYVVVCDHFR